MKAIIIHESGAIAMQEINSLDDFHRAVGGWIEHILLDDASAYVNEEGKLKGMDLNHKATRIFHEHYRTNDVIVGPMVIVGPINGEGDNTDVTQKWIDKLIGRQA